MKKAFRIGWQSLMAAVITAAAGAATLGVGMPWLFPSLGPTLFLQIAEPRNSSSKPRNVLIGHVAGAGAGFLAAWAFGVGNLPSVFEMGDPPPERLAASVVALAISVAAQEALKAPHPASASTALLITLGSFSVDARSAVAIAGGVVIVGFLGEIGRQISLRL